MTNQNQSRLFKLITIPLIIVGTITGALGMELIMGAETFWQHAICWLIAIVVGIVLYGLWKIQETIFITIDPLYRDKRLWAVHILTPIFAVLVSGMASFVYVYHNTAYRLHMEEGIVDAQNSINHAAKSANRILLFKDVVRSKVGSLEDLAKSEENGLVTGVGGRGEIYRRIIEGKDKLNGISDLLIQSEININSLLDSANIQIQRMRRAIPVNGSPFDGLEAYTKAQRNFFTDFQTLSEQNLALQVKTMLSGFEQTMVSTHDRDQATHMARVNREMGIISESIIAALEEQDIKIEQPPEWRVSSPIYLSVLYIANGWSIALMVILLEVSPIFLVWAQWAKHRQTIAEPIEESTVSLKSLETLVTAIKRIIQLNKDLTKGDDE
ncbi:hypothetical protein LJ739_10655 [Aestuariibacter halophilus]|uniref:Uncharacterized protein n=1 Tax=Fluctibacter halophilus TaxID=226011 RepID=A0ABS8G9B0_9ALTE|nr:hypothetical protein [Aestuariibacter halophilus]MCC2616701.1 hypothetical protein [Aestuariibacter halophilus]